MFSCFHENVLCLSWHNVLGLRFIVYLTIFRKKLVADIVKFALKLYTLIAEVLLMHFKIRIDNFFNEKLVV